MATPTAEIINFVASILSIASISAALYQKFGTRRLPFARIKQLVTHPKATKALGNIRAVAQSAVNKAAEDKKLTRRWLITAAICLVVALPFWWHKYRNAQMSQQIAAQIAAGQQSEARRTIEQELASGNETDALVKLMGDLDCSTHNYDACIIDYTKAGKLGFTLPDDALFIKNMRVLTGRKSQLAGLVSMAKTEPEMFNQVFQSFMSDTDSDVRWGAISVLKATGGAKGLDLAAPYIADLRDESCTKRKSAAKHLAELGEVRAIPELQHALESADFFGRICAGGAMKRAIRRLENPGVQAGDGD